MLQSDFYGTIGAAHLIQTFLWRKTRLLWFARLLTLLISGDIAKKKSESSASIKFNESEE